MAVPPGSGPPGGLATMGMARIRKWWAKWQGRPAAVSQDKEPAGAKTTYAPEFVEFVAQRRHLNRESAAALIARAENVFAGGWGGGEYRRFSEQAYETCRPLYDDGADSNLPETYKVQAAFDFLRMLSYPVPAEKDLEPILCHLSKLKQAVIVDYGCGLAHRTMALSRYLQARGICVTLHLVDIRRDIHFEFLEYLCAQHGIPHEYIEITAAQLYPPLPACDYCDIVDVFEHLREPLIAAGNIHRALRPGGWILADVADHQPEMMHLSPNLQPVRDYFARLGYAARGKVLWTNLMQKPSP